MRIAQVAPLFESVPPHTYGGTERVVSYLTEELVRLGHQVTLFASGDSRTSAELIPICSRSLRLDRRAVDPQAVHVAMIEKVARIAGRFDIIHFHVDYTHFPVSRRSNYRHVTTLHGRLDIPELPVLYRQYPDIPVISISDAQRRPLPWLRWQGTVLHGLPEDLFSFQERSEDYLLFLGRFSPEKGPERAIEIAGRLGMPLKIAAKVDRADRDYFERDIKPLLKQPGVEYLGEVGGADKEELLGHARALLFPIDWPEPFGLVMIEALSCGTPVIAWRRGSVPEVIEDGVTGFIVESVEEAVEAVGRAANLDRAQVHEQFLARFTATRMAHDYLAIYQKLAASPRSAVGVLRAPVMDVIDRYAPPDGRGASDNRSPAAKRGNPTAR
jgi:glycosyltransferase involved in cell wall biosynthesis